MCLSAGYIHSECSGEDSAFLLLLVALISVSRDRGSCLVMFIPSTYLAVLASLKKEVLSVQTTPTPIPNLSQHDPFLPGDHRSRLSAGLGLAGPDLLGMGGLTADEDFGEGRGLTVGILHQHTVGARVFSHTSGKEKGRSSVGVHAPLQLRKAGWEGSLGGGPGTVYLWAGHWVLLVEASRS